MSEISMIMLIVVFIVGAFLLVLAFMIMSYRRSDNKTNWPPVGSRIPIPPWPQEKISKSAGISGTSSAYPPPPPPIKGQEVSRLNRRVEPVIVHENNERRDDSGDFITGMAVGAITNNAVLGGIIGGSFVGGIIGDIARDGSIGESTESSDSISESSSSSYDSSGDSSSSCGD